MMTNKRKASTDNLMQQPPLKKLAVDGSLGAMSMNSMPVDMQAGYCWIFCWHWHILRWPVINVLPVIKRAILRKGVGWSNRKDIFYPCSGLERGHGCRAVPFVIV